MEVIAFIASYGPWAWIIGGIVLLAIELVVPGGIFVWLGAAAVVTGVLTLFVPMGWPIQWVVFGVLAILSLIGWLRFSRRNRGEESDRPFLNQRAARFIGQTVALSEPIKDGFGRVVLGDTTWRVTGPDLAVGTRVKIVGHEAAVLKVEAAD